MPPTIATIKAQIPIITIAELGIMPRKKPTIIPIKLFIIGEGVFCELVIIDLSKCSCTYRNDSFCITRQTLMAKWANGLAQRQRRDWRDT